MAEKKEIIIDIEINSKVAEKRTVDLKKRLEEQKEALKGVQKEIKALDKESVTYSDDLARLTAEQIKQENAIKKTQAQYNIQNKILQANSNSVEALTAQNARYSDALKRIDTSTVRGAKLFEQLTQKIDENKQKLKDATNEAKGSISAYKKLSDSLTTMRNEWRDLAATQAQGGKLTKEQTKRFKELETQINETDAALKEIDGDMGQFTRNVGNYKNSINEAIQENAGLFESFGNVGEGAGDFMQKFKAMGASLLANPIGAVIAVLAVLVAAFTQTATGAGKMKDLMGGLSGIFNKVLGDVGKLAVKLFDFFSLLATDPVTALETLGTAIKDNLINRFEAFAALIPNIASLLGDLLSGNFKEAAKSGQKLTDTVIQMGTGVINMTQKTADYAKELQYAAAEGVKFAQIQRQIAAENRALTISIAKLTGQLEVSRSTMNDDTLGWKERKKAAEVSFKTIDALAKKEIGLAQNKLKSVQAEMAMRSKNGLDVSSMADAQTEALAGVIQAENNYTATVRDLGEERRKLTRDEMESRVDVLLDVADREKAISEQKIADGRVDAAERAKLLETLKNAEGLNLQDRIKLLANFDEMQKQSLSERRALLAQSTLDYRKSTDSAIAEIEKQEKKEIDFAAILAEIDTEKRLAMMKELNLSEISQNVLRDLTINRIQAEQDFIATKDLLLDEQIASEMAKRTKQIEDEKFLMQIKADNELNSSVAKNAAMDAQYALDIAKYDKNEAIKAEITKKYEKAKTDLKKMELQMQLNATADMLGQGASLFKEQTVAYKVLMSAQAAINTYTAATAAYASAAAVPVIGYILGPIAAGLAIASGLANIAKINGVQFADGGMINGNSHASGGVPFSVGGRVGFEAEGGEFITNKASTAMSGDALATINANPNVGFRAVPYASGGAVSTSPAMSRNATEQSRNKAVAEMRPVVTVESIRRAFERVDVQDRRVII